MAFLTSQRISALAVQLLSRRLVLPATVSRVAGTEFSGGNGDTVTIRVPQGTAARQQMTPGAVITFDTLDEVPVEVSLKHFYHAIRLPDESLTWEIVDFGRQVLLPQVTAVALRAEDELASVMNALPEDMDINGPDDVDDAVLEASEALDEMDVPADGRFLALSPSLATAFLKTNLLTEVDTSGSSDGLRRAVIGDYRGFTTLKSNGLTRGTGVAYHSTGFAFANRAPIIPDGAVQASVTMQQNIALRQLLQYDPTRLSDQSVISTFAGAALVAADRVFKLGSSES